MQEKDKFLNFPIQLLQGFLDNHQKCLKNIFDYSVFKLVFSEDSVYESLDEFSDEWSITIPQLVRERILANGRIHYDSFSGTNAPWTGIHSNTYFKIREEKDEFRLIVFLAFTAFKSVIQKKSWSNVKNDLLLSRMAGFPNVIREVFPDYIPDKILFWMKPKSGRRKKVFQYLEEYNRLVYLPKSRGITFSLTRSFKQLVYHTEEKKALKEISKKDKVDEKRRDIDEVKAMFKELIQNPYKNLNTNHNPNQDTNL